jgi:hypothetical protein
MNLPGQLQLALGSAYRIGCDLGGVMSRRR